MIRLRKIRHDNHLCVRSTARGTCHAQAMTSQSVSAFVRAHLSGRAAIRIMLPVKPPDEVAE